MGNCGFMGKGYRSPKRYAKNRREGKKETVKVLRVQKRLLDSRGPRESRQQGSEGEEVDEGRVG